MEKKVERRSVVLTPEVRAEGDKRLIAGHAAVFSSPTEIFPGFIEQISPGAFRDTIANDDIVMLINHDMSGLPLGRKSAGTLSLREDDKGLFIECDPPAWASNIVEAIDRGDIRGMSFGFFVLEETWTALENGDVLRTILRAQVFEVSAVTWPAYEATDIGVRSDLVLAGIEAGEFDEAVTRSKVGQATESDRAVLSKSLAVLRSKVIGGAGGDKVAQASIRGQLEAMKARIEILQRL